LRNGIFCNTIYTEHKYDVASVEFVLHHIPNNQK